MLYTYNVCLYIEHIHAIGSSKYKLTKITKMFQEIQYIQFKSKY